MVRYGVSSAIRLGLSLTLVTGLCACGSNDHGSSPKRSDSSSTGHKPSTDADRPIARSPQAPNRTYPPARPNLNPPLSTQPAASIRDQAVKKVEKAADVVLDFVAPGAPQRTREAGLANARAIDQQYRNLSVDQLQYTLNVNSPNAEVISTVLHSRSDNEVIKWLSRYLTETNPKRAASNASLLLGEIFADPKYASSKLAEIAFDLGEIARRGYYDEAIAGRVALLQARLDEQIGSARRNGLVTNALFIVGSAVASGFVAGREMKVLDRATESVRSVKWAELMKMPSFKGAAERGMKSGTTLERIARRAASLLPEASTDVARSELGVLKVSETEINRLNLKPATKDDLQFLMGRDQPANSKQLKWLPTDRERVQYAFSKYYDGKLVGQRAMFLKIRRPMRPDQILSGPVMDNAEAKFWYDRLKKNPKVEYLNMDDGNADVVQSAIRADTRSEFSGQAAPMPFAVKLGDTPPTPEFVPRAPVAEVQPKNFNWVRAAITATTIGSLTTVPTVMAYSYGDREGRDMENTYLERQVDRNARPPETVVSDLNQK